MVRQRVASSTADYKFIDKDSILFLLPHLEEERAMKIRVESKPPLSLSLWLRRIHLLLAHVKCLLKSHRQLSHVPFGDQIRFVVAKKV